MESYAIESARPHPGIDEALRQHIDIAAMRSCSAGCAVQRHVEVFDALAA